MRQIQNAIEAKRLASLTVLDKFLNSVVCEISSGIRENEYKWELVESSNYKDFERDVKVISEDKKHQIYQALLTSLFQWIVKFEDMRDNLDEGWEFSLCQEAEMLVFKYVAVVIGQTLFDFPENCAYQIVKDVRLLPKSYSRERLLLLFTRPFGLSETEAKRYKMDQCNKCSKRNCDGRYSDVLCGQAEWLRTNCDDLIFRERNLQPHNKLGANISIHNTNFFFNENTQNNYSFIQQNYHSDEVFMIAEAEREKVLRDNMSPKQLARLNECVRKLKELGICNEDGQFDNETLQAMLKKYGDKAVINGQMVDGALKGLFADAVRKEVGLNTSWIEVQAMFNEDGMGTRLSRALRYKKSVKESEKGVFRCLLEIVQAVFPKYLP